MKLLLLTIFLLAAAVVMLCIKIIFVKGGKFPTGHVHDIPALRKKGIGCATSASEKRRYTNKLK